MIFLCSKYFFSLASISILTALLGGCDAPSKTPTPPVVFADMVLHNGVVATVDDAFGNVQAIAVTGHEIIAVGSN